MANVSRLLGPGKHLFASILLLWLLPAAGCSQRSKPPEASGGQNGFRAVTIDVDEVTQPETAASPDGSFVVFNILGHLFLLPAEGGAAEQLTSGLSYESKPAISPDGRKVAFVSDRDGSSGNVFVLDLATRRLNQITHEELAAGPHWSPDGRTLAYLRCLQREEHPLNKEGENRVELRTVASEGGQPGVVASPNTIRSIFYFPDGRLGWVVQDLPAQEFRVEARAADGKTIVLLATSENLSKAILNRAGNGVVFNSGKTLKSVSFADGKPVVIAPLTENSVSSALAGDDSTLFYADRGRLYRRKPGEGAPEPITWKAQVAVELRRPSEFKWSPPTAAEAAPRTIVSPQQSPDGKRLIFMAAGFIYEQTDDGRPAHRLFEGGAFERDPALSPDGRRLVYAASLDGRRELRLHDFESRKTRVLRTLGGDVWALWPSWSADGQQIVFQQSEELYKPFKIISLDVASGETRELVTVNNQWTGRPQFSPDGKWLYYTARDEKIAAFYRKPLNRDAKAEAVTALSRHVVDGLISPDGNWFAFRRNTEVWLAPLGGGAPIRDSRLQRVTDDCSRSFAFTPDSSAILYAGGSRVWRQPLAGGERSEIPIRLKLQHPAAEPLLVRRVRVLDFDRGGFGEPVSILIQDGKIQWIGAERGRTLPENASVLEAGGRHAIPGLMDAHVHSAWTNHVTSEDAFIAFGNTSVRDVGSSLDMLSALSDRSESTLLPAPRYWYSGDLMEGAIPIWGDAMTTIANEQEARLTVRRYKEWGADFIKIYDSLPYSLKRVIAEEAQRRGLPAAGHCTPLSKLVRHVSMGFHSIEHTLNVMYGDGFRFMAAAAPRWCATLTCEGGMQQFIHDEPERLETDLAGEYIPEQKIRFARTGGVLFGAPKEIRDANMKDHYDRIYRAYRDGVKITAGTDAMMTEMFFGLTLHWELEFLKAAGFTPLAALRTATLENAEAVGASDYLGSLKPGKLADVVILDANPLENIRNTTRIWRVIKAGRLFDPKSMRNSGKDVP